MCQPTSLHARPSMQEYRGKGEKWPCRRMEKYLAELKFLNSPLLSPRGSFGRLCACTLSRSVMSCSFATPRTVVQQAPLSMNFPRQEYWSGLSFPPPGNPPDTGIKPVSLASPALQADSLPLNHLCKSAFLCQTLPLSSSLFFH